MSPISSRSISPDENGTEKRKDRFDSITYQNEAYDRVEQEDQVDSGKFKLMRDDRAPFYSSVYI